MSTKDKIFKNFGPDVLRAVTDWQRRGYTVTHPNSRLIITDEKTELVVESWPGTAVCELRSPITIRREVPALLFGEYESGASARTAAVINDLLAEAERHHRKLPNEIRKTFSREWRSSIDEAEGRGYQVQWIVPHRKGCLEFTNPEKYIRVFYSGSNQYWVMGMIVEGDMSQSRADFPTTDEAAIYLLRKWLKTKRVVAEASA